MKSYFDQVTEFHRAYDLPAPTSPCELQDSRQMLRHNLIQEEFDEYVGAVIRGDLIEIADALADLTYVVVGTAAEHGLTRFDEIFAEVHRSNMSKLGPNGQPILRPDGKVLKGPDYTPPNLKPLIE